MSFDSVLAELDEAISLVQRVADTRYLTVPLSAQSMVKVENLRRTGRDFFKVTPEFSAAVARGFDSSFRFRGDPQSAWKGAATAAKKHILARFEANGADVPMRSLKMTTLAYKAKHSLSLLIGVMRRDLRNELSARTFTFR